MVVFLMIDCCKNCQLSSYEYFKTICFEENSMKYLWITEIISKMEVAKVIVKLFCLEVQIQIFQTGLNAALLIVYNYYFNHLLVEVYS